MAPTNFGGSASTTLNSNSMIGWNTTGTSYICNMTDTTASGDGYQSWQSFGLDEFKIPWEPRLTDKSRDFQHDTVRYRYEVEVAHEALMAYRQDMEQLTREHAVRAIRDEIRRTVSPGEVLMLPDGCRLRVDRDGNWVLDDSEQKVIYRKNNNRAFNPFVNAGDLVADFIRYVREEVGVRPDLIPQLPLGLMVNWLIIEAAERDGDPTPDGVTPIEQDRALIGAVHPRCQLATCRRFVRRDWARNGFPFCDGDHAAEAGRLLRAA